MKVRRLVVVTACALLLGGVVSTPAASTASTAAPERAPAGLAAVPDLEVSTVQDGLSIPWDLTFLPNGAFLYTQRSRLTVRLHRTDGTDVSVAIDNSSMWSSGETGLMSILAAPTFADSRLFWTCQGAETGVPGEHQVQVSLWRLGPAARAAERVRNVINGLPSTSGRHGGCRLRFGAEGALYVGTGDAATTENPQSLTSGGGKVLRVVPRTGAGWPDNRWADAHNPMKRRIYTYGHRNVQGLALRADGVMWSVEHGSYRDDEVNRLQVGGNYGWQPGPGYDETPPMTDFTLPGRQIGARWSSGDPTIATSGAVWLHGAEWGVWDGALAVCTLKDHSLRIMQFEADGDFVQMWTPALLDGPDRLRTPVLGPDGALYVTTSSETGSRILRVVPSG